MAPQIVDEIETCLNLRVLSNVQAHTHPTTGAISRDNPQRNQGPKLHGETEKVTTNLKHVRRELEKHHVTPKLVGKIDADRTVIGLYMPLFELTTLSVTGCGFAYCTLARPPTVPWSLPA